MTNGALISKLFFTCTKSALFKYISINDTGTSKKLMFSHINNLSILVKHHSKDKGIAFPHPFK